MQGRARRRAAGVLSEDARLFGAAGYRPDPRRDPLRARLHAGGLPDLVISMRATGGRIFGGTFAMEVATAEPVFPPTAGVTARGRGVVRLRTIDFRGRGGDAGAVRLAERLGGDERLIRALSAVHFEQVRVEPEGRVTIRHMGGALVWMLFPPMTRPIPITPEQVHATVTALDAFARSGAAGS